MKLKASRRRFLAAAGGSALALPFLRALPGYGQTETKRFLILAFCGNGVVRHTWGAEKLGPERGNIALHQSFQTALDPYKDYLTIVNGLRNKSADDIGGTHEGGMESLWTGGKGPSIDQIVGPTLGGVRPTLEFRVMSNEDETNRTRNNRMIFDGSGVPIDPREDAAAAATQLFAGIGMTRSGGGAQRHAARAGVRAARAGADGDQAAALRGGPDAPGGAAFGLGHGPAAAEEREDADLHQAVGDDQQRLLLPRSLAVDDRRAGGVSRLRPHAHRQPAVVAGAQQLGAGRVPGDHGEAPRHLARSSRTTRA